MSVWLFHWLCCVSGNKRKLPGQWVAGPRKPDSSSHCEPSRVVSQGPNTAKYKSYQGTSRTLQQQTNLGVNFTIARSHRPPLLRLQCVSSDKSEWEKLKLRPTNMQLRLIRRKVRETDSRRRTGGSPCARHCAVNTKGEKKKSGLIGSYSLRVSAVCLTGTAFNQTRPAGSTADHM